MAGLDIYDDTENLISSDEYCDDDDDDDDLINVAISSENASKDVKVPKCENEKLKEIKLLIRRNKLSTLYKKRSIKWLNNKARREKWKQYLITVTKRSKERKPTPTEDKVVEEEKTAPNNVVAETINVNDDDDNDCSKKNTKENEAYSKNEGNNLSVNIDVEYNEKDKNNDKKYTPTIESIESTLCTTKNLKRLRSPSPLPRLSTLPESNNCNASKKQQTENPYSTLYKEVNEMFFKYDEAIEKHIKVNNSSLESINDNITRILLEIQTLNDILQVKEIEWNRLLHLKSVKEEILSRLSRIRHVVEIKKTQPSNLKYTLPELKELELYLSEPHPSSKHMNPASTAQQLIESRANMKTDELKKERSNTNRLQSILISSHILPKHDDSLGATENNIASTKKEDLLQAYQYLEMKKKVNVGRQGPFKDVKSIIADFRQRNQDVIPRVGKRVKANETISNVNNFKFPYTAEASFDSVNANFTPTLEKLLNTSSRNNPVKNIKNSKGIKFNKDDQQNFYRLQNDDFCNEISITPVSNDDRYLQNEKEYKSNLLRSALHTKSQSHAYVTALNEKTNYDDHRGNTLIDSEAQLCQECKSHEARFVCAGCGNQWYCSRSCQITAWDKHSEMCNE